MKYLTLILVNMFVFACKITIGSYSFTAVNQGTINYSIHSLIQTARISIPLSARLHDAGQVTKVDTSKVFKKGDSVSIEIGYNGQMYPEFNGYVSAITYGSPLVIDCEDSMFIVRKNHITKSEKNIKLKEIIDLCLNGLYKIEGEVPDMTINDFAVKDEPATNILQNIRNDYGLAIFFTPKAKLYCGLLYGYQAGSVKYDFSINVLPTKNQLKYLDADETRIKIIAKSWLKTGGLIEAEVGDSDGNTRTLWFYDIQDQEALKKRAEAEIDKFKYSGYSGYFTTKLQPYAEIGMNCELNDPKYTERSGRYYIESIETTFGHSGSYRKIEPGIKI
ncbi:MAG: hypothetical protein GX587_08220 [Bacteroidales bacterium]|nr:hypothetical protein [Bacteroidales bacterium]